MGRPWTDRDTEDLVAAYSEALSVPEIGVRLGRRTETVYRHLRMLGFHVVRPVETCPWAEKAIELYKEKPNCEWIGRQLKRDGSTIRRKLTELGIHKATSVNAGKAGKRIYHKFQFNRDEVEDRPLRPCMGVLCQGRVMFKPESRYVIRCMRCRTHVASYHA